MLGRCPGLDVFDFGKLSNRSWTHSLDVLMERNGASQSTPAANTRAAPGVALPPRRLEQEPVELAVQAHVRHEYTSYDDLLSAGLERWEARQIVQSDVVAFGIYGKPNSSSRLACPCRAS